jgi:raffinose/stachyose/melibiose transport system substrate-binding protein
MQHLLMNNSIPETMLGATFAEAANSFYNNDTIMIFNGPWMFGSFREETGAGDWGPDFHGDTVVADLFPGNIALELPAEIGLYWVAADAGEDQIRAALAYLEFFLSDAEMARHLIQSGGMSPGFTPTPEFHAQVAEDRILQLYMQALETHPTVVPRLDQITFDSIAQPDMPNLLPLLADGTLTPEQFAQTLTDLAAEVVAAGGG